MPLNTLFMLRIQTFFTTAAQSEYRLGRKTSRHIPVNKLHWRNLPLIVLLGSTHHSIILQADMPLLFFNPQ